MDLTAEIAAAARRLEGRIVRTPLRHSPALSEAFGARVLLKCEHLQHTGSFKLRGATNAVQALATQPDPPAAVVTASSGNHGLAVATAAAATGMTARVFVARTASATKQAAIRRAGGQVVVVDSTDALQAEVAARATAADEGLPYLSPYNDPLVIAGQGTIGLEIAEDAPEDLDAVVVPVGGGGLISGIASWLSSARPDVEVVGAQPRVDAAMAESVAAGRIIAIDGGKTLSDGTAGNVEEGAITFELCRRLVDRWELVDEPAIAGGILDMVELEHQLVEGAAGMALAATRALARDRPGSILVAVLCGANLGVEGLRRALRLTG